MICPIRHLHVLVVSLLPRSYFTITLPSPIFFFLFLLLLLFVLLVLCPLSLMFLLPVLLPSSSSLFVYFCFFYRSFLAAAAAAPPSCSPSSPYHPLPLLHRSYFPFPSQPSPFLFLPFLLVFLYYTSEALFLFSYIQCYI